MTLKKTTGIISTFLAFVLLFSISAFAITYPGLEDAITDTAEYMLSTVKAPQVGSVGGEWAIVGLARSGCHVPDGYYQNYYAAVEDYVKACNGILHAKKYTEYSRLIVALSAIGKDARNVGGYDLTKALGDYEKTIWQGLNGPVWALISLDSGGYEMPENSDAKVQATREMYIDRILACQLPDGGFSLFGGTAAAASGDNVSDPDITGMALQALAKYQDNEKVKRVTKEALDCMSGLQKPDGGFASWGTDNSESVVQIIVALSELGIPPDDPRFVKNGNTLLNNLMTYYKKGSGFNHTTDGSGSNQMATEQAFYGLVAAQRLNSGKNSLYRMDDAIKIPDAKKGDAHRIGLEGKHSDIHVMPIKNLGKTFSDIVAHENQPAIEALAARKIISGKSEDLFDPDNSMTRAEFTAVVVRGLGLEIKDGNVFADVFPKDWFSGYINTALSYGIVNGISETEFDPSGSVSREEAAAMIVRAAALCGMDTDLTTSETRDTLAAFTDYVTASDWARSPLAFCYREEILPDYAMEILPKAQIKRCEIAQMLFNLLYASKLI